MKLATNLIWATFLTAATSFSWAECVGTGDYRVCSEINTGANGDIEVRSWDSEGNTYSVNTESHTSGNGSTIRSYDSEGNEYTVRSWTDKNGVHSEDSEGNRCTITHSGQTIGCD